MSGGEFLQRREELTALAERPDVSPLELQNVAWQTLGEVMSHPPTDDETLLPQARLLFERLANDQALQAAQTDTYLNARMTLATWDVLSASYRHEPIPEGVRFASCRSLGTLLENFSFQKADTNKGTAQKMCEATILALLLRAPERSAILGLPAPPGAHHFRGVDEITGTTSFQVYGVSRDKVVPMYVNTFQRSHMEIPERHKGVLVVGLGRLLMHVAQSNHIINQEFGRREGSLKHRQRWLVDLVAQTLVQQAVEATLPDYPEHRFLRQASAKLKWLVERFEAPQSSTPYFRTAPFPYSRQLPTV